MIAEGTGGLYSRRRDHSSNRSFAGIKQLQMQVSGIGEQCRLYHHVLISFHHFFRGMREEYQHLIEWATSAAKSPF